MAKSRKPVAATDDQVCTLLERYACPVPFHEVRTRFLGNIASLTSTSPIDVVKELWGGELPEFSDIDAANELIGALVMGLWNRLTQHQDRGTPFRLVRVAQPETQEGLHRLTSSVAKRLTGSRMGCSGTRRWSICPNVLTGRSTISPKHACCSRTCTTPHARL
jgi:hypothetical protein